MSSRVLRVSEECVGAFLRLTGERPQWGAMAPGRVNVIGEHIDYQDGWVLPMAIDRATCIVASPLPGQRVVVTSSSQEETLSIEVSDPMGSCGRSWGKYLAGVLTEFMAVCPVPIQGFHAHVHSDIPLGAGLSSSAALEVAMATLLEAITGHRLGLEEKATLCQRAERDRVGVPCGIMDQMITVLGQKDKLLLLDCVTQDHHFIPFGSSEVSVLVVDTGVSHALKDGAYAARREESEKALDTLGKRSYRGLDLKALETAASDMEEVLQRRARHVITEMKRTQDTARAVEVGDWKRAGQFLYESHRSLAQDYEVSCEALDVVVDSFEALGEEAGVYGARMTGGGFGGCVIALVAVGREEAIAETIGRGYKNAFGRLPDTFVTRPCAGAKILSL